jgi:hypothetical protein
VENSTGNHIKLTYSYVVKAVNSDGVETASTAVSAADVVGPKLTGNYSAQLAAGTNTLVLQFNEPLDKTSAQTASNYALSNVDPVTITSATYNEATWQVTLKLSAVLKVAAPARNYIDTGVNGILQSVAGANDIATIKLNEGEANALCVGPGANGVINSLPLIGDDQSGLNTILAGLNGICQTAKAGDDVQTIPVGQGKPSAPAITAGPSLVLQAVPGGDDVLHVSNATVLKISNVKDVAGNVIDPKFNGFGASGTVGQMP